MIYIIAVLLILQILVLSIFVYQSIMQRNSFNSKQFLSKIMLDKFDVIVAAREDYETINKCIKNVLSVGFENIIICIDGGNNDVFYRLKSAYPSLTILYNDIGGNVNMETNQYKNIKLTRENRRSKLCNTFR